MQLDSVGAENLSPINLEDFPNEAATALQSQALTVRRAFRYSDTKAVAMLKAGDALMIAGKGHETGQIIKGVTHPFSDQDVARAALESQA